MGENVYEKIRRLVSMLRDEDVDEIEVRRWWTAIRVARRRPREAAESAYAPGHAGAAANEDVSGAHGSSPSTREGMTLAEGSAASAKAAAHASRVMSEIISPMVGTFYRAPAPGAEPFVSEGDRVEVGEVLCIIEAMKLMNEIEADRSGIVRRVLVQDSQPVEYGQPLFLVESA